jgi:hypothetical protein
MQARTGMNAGVSALLAVPGLEGLRGLFPSLGHPPPPPLLPLSGGARRGGGYLPLRMLQSAMMDAAAAAGGMVAHAHAQAAAGVALCFRPGVHGCCVAELYGRHRELLKCHTIEDDSIRFLVCCQLDGSCLASRVVMCS